MRLSRYFLPVLKETPTEAQIVSHRLMLRAGLIRQEAAGHLCLAAARLSRAAEDRADRARGNEPRRRDRNPHADAAARRSVARDRPLRRLWPGDAAHQGSPRARADLRSHQRGHGDGNFPRLCPFVQGAAAQSLSHPVEIPRRGASALRRDARPRIPDEGCLFLRPRQGRRAAFVQQDVCRLSAHVLAHGTEDDSDARGNRPHRRRSQPRVHRARRHRRERGVLPQGSARHADARRGRRFRLRSRADRAPAHETLCRDGGRARPGAVRNGSSGRQARSRRAASRSGRSSISARNIPCR